jgi:glutaconate CoA-transferase subunit B
MDGNERAFAPGELMVVAAAREIRDAEWVFVGMRLPLLAFLVAKRLHAPRAVALFENGVIRTEPAAEMLYTMGDLPNLRRATSCTELLTVMGLLQQGRVNLGLLGAAEVDRFGNLNTTRVRQPDGWMQLPGSGGACDIASLAQRYVVLLPHARHRLVERVGFLTSPGFGEGAGWRERAGLPRGGPSALITSKAIFRFDASGRAVLASVHPGVSPAEVAQETGWPVATAGAGATPPPTAEELRVLRELDPDGYWTRAKDR